MGAGGRRGLLVGGGGGGTYTAKSVIFDFANNFGPSTYMGFRCVEFLFSAAVLPVSGTSGETSVLNASYTFDDSVYNVDKLGGAAAGWISDAVGGVNQRCYATFTNPITFDSLVINNYHNVGNDTELGVENAKIYTTEDTGAISTVYDSAITGGVLIYDGVFAEHVALNQADDETLTLI